jgi:hypothetical protein
VVSLSGFGGDCFPEHESLVTEEAYSLLSLSTRLTGVRMLKLKTVEALQVLSLQQQQPRHQLQSSIEGQALPRILRWCMSAWRTLASLPRLWLPDGLIQRTACFPRLAELHVSLKVEVSDPEWARRACCHP